VVLACCGSAVTLCACNVLYDAGKRNTQQMQLHTNMLLLLLLELATPQLQGGPQPPNATSAHLGVSHKLFDG
jgi:hypothetical protein